MPQSADGAHLDPERVCWLPRLPPGRPGCGARSPAPRRGPNWPRYSARPGAAWAACCPSSTPAGPTSPLPPGSRCPSSSSSSSGCRAGSDGQRARVQHPGQARRGQPDRGRRRGAPSRRDRLVPLVVIPGSPEDYDQPSGQQDRRDDRDEDEVSEGRAQLTVHISDCPPPKAGAHHLDRLVSKRPIAPPRAACCSSSARPRRRSR